MSLVTINDNAKITKEQNKKSYTSDEVYKASLKYFNGNELAANVFTNKYALRDKNDNYYELTPDDMHDRLAAEFARIDSNYGLDYDERFSVYRDAMDKFSKIVPQGSPMAAIGNKYQLMSASNCVVVSSPTDSINGIINTGLELANLFRRRCGVGLDISTLRPDGMPVNNAAKTTSGAWSFADFYSYICRMIAQNGRRGALMITLDVHHPDVEKFATMKSDLKKVTGANVSIKLSDEFLKAVEQDTTYEQRWPCEPPYKITKQVSAKKVWDIIVEQATNSAEPGVVFWDSITRRLPANEYPGFESVSLNPCAEISLSPADSCRLISINLTGYVRNAFTDPYFDMESFLFDVDLAQQMADNLVDLELELIDRIVDVCNTKAEKDLWRRLWKAGHNGRRTGLGTHGLADTLAQLGIKYDSDDSIKFCDNLYRQFRDQAYATSIRLSQERGSFPVFNWDTEKDNEFIKDLPDHLKEAMALTGRRNISLLTQAPTGSVSLLSKVGRFYRFNLSSGVEPVFRNSYTRRKKINPQDYDARVDFIDELGDKWQHFDVFHENVLSYYEATGKEIGADLPDYFVTSDQIDWKFRIKLQASEQKYLDHSISSTINLPSGTSSDAVGEIYLEGWRQGLKGVTVYVDGSRTGVLVTNNDNKIDPSKRPDKIIRMEAPKRPKSLSCDLHVHSVHGKSWVAIVGLMEGEPYELFGGYSEELSKLFKRFKTGKITRTGKGKYNLDYFNDEESGQVIDLLRLFNGDGLGWTTRLMSTSLRHGVPIEFLVHQLNRDGVIGDFNKVLARVLKKYIKDGTKVKSSVVCEGKNSSGDPCQNSNMLYSEGCVSCPECGWTKCG